DRGAKLEELAPSDVDILHLRGTPRPAPKRPFVVTIDGNGQPGEEFHRNTIFISRSHAQNHGSTEFVYNGIDPGEYRSEAERGDYAVFLAKASWSVKNLSGAIEVSRRAGVRLLVCGSRNWPLALQRSLPAWRGVKYMGTVTDAEKREILSRARALIFPVRWHEPFGLAVTEALASGCPVLGTPYGSLPEIVTAEVGALAADAGALARALRERPFDSARCRARVEQGFTHLQMADGYLRYYEAVLASGVISPRAPEMPRTRAGGEGFSSKSLLSWES
ncbi:MAG: glycosyltransferase, partial [Bdellovibrionota bacterium]